MAFQPVLLEVIELSVQTTSPLRRCFSQILRLAESTFAIANSLCYYCIQCWKKIGNERILAVYQEEIVSFILFGPSRKGQVEVTLGTNTSSVSVVPSMFGMTTSDEENVLDYDLQVKQYDPLSYAQLSIRTITQSDHYLRASVMGFLLYLIKEQSSFSRETATLPESSKSDGGVIADRRLDLSNFLEGMLFALLEEQYSLGLKRYRPWSQTHRQLIRLWQCIDLFVDYLGFLSSTSAQQLMEVIWKSLLNFNHRTVRNYMDLFTVYFFTKQPQFIEDKLKEALDRVNERSDVMHSFLTITAYILMTFDLCQADSIRKCNKLLLAFVSHATTNHAIIRRMVQLLLVKIIEYWEIQKSPISLDPFIISLYRYIQTNEECQRLQSRPTAFIQFVDPTKIVDSHSESTSFLIPLLLSWFSVDEGFPLMEAINPGIFFEWIAISFPEISSMDRTTHSSFPHRNDKDVIEANSVLAQTDEFFCAGDFQKKIVPFAPDDSQNTYESMDREVSVEHMKMKQDIIVIASLLDKIPNLAGLTRTCEIFNATALVVSNKKVGNNPIFREISVTAEKWVPMLEVPVDELSAYLQEKKREGWTLVGVEQTANSINLLNFQFPKRTVLLLGKEKEGIPVEFLQLIDLCVQIPQLGIIRSLNVHVSGSIMIWEYTKQQLLGMQR